MPPVACSRRPRRVLALAATLCATIGAPLLAPARAEEGSARFYFFSPDWRPGDLNRLTERVQSILGDQGLDVTFQAFTRYEDFVVQVRNTPPDFVIAPAWFEDLAKEPPAMRLKVLARPLRHGRSIYRKALMTRPELDSIDDLTHGSIAATIHSMGAGSERVVLDAFHLDADSAKVVPVPKDVDALLALSFGQVDAALVTAQQYELLAQSNPAVVDKLQVLAFSPEIPLPALYATGTADAAFGERLASALAALGETAAGTEILDLLGYDAFAAGDAASGRAVTRPIPSRSIPAARAAAAALNPPAIPVPAPASEEPMGPPLPPHMQQGR